MGSTGEGLCMTLMVGNGKEPKLEETVLFISNPFAHMQCHNSESKLYVGLLSDRQNYEL